MRSPNKDMTDRRSTDRRAAPSSDRRMEVSRQVDGDRRVVENRGIGDAMVDALEDILRWERASERMPVAPPSN